MIRKTIIVVMTLLAIGTAIAWADSYCHHSEDYWGGHHYGMRGSRYVFALDQNHSAMVTWTRGYISFVSTDVSPPADGNEMQFVQGLYSLWGLGNRKAGFGSTPTNNAWQYSWLGFPAWAPFTLFVIYPTIAFIRGPLRRYRRRRKGLCVHCGYNLMGNTTGICSECGMEIKP